MLKQHPILRKILISIGILWIIITLNFVIIRLVPGDMVVNILGENEYYRVLEEYPEKIELTREKYGLDQPLIIQYLKYLKNTATLDFGYSYINKQPVTTYVLYHMKWTLVLMIPVFLVSAVLGGGLGLMAGWRQNSVLDRIMTPLFLFLNTIPSNCIAVLCLTFFSFRLGIFPISGMSSGGLEGIHRILDILWHMSLPFLILSFFRTGSNFIYMKSYAARISSEDYIVTAVAKGLSAKKVLFRHALRNIFPQYITLLCMQMGHILSGSMMIEVIFSWKGMGKLLSDAATSKDFPVLQFSFLLISICVLSFNFLADVITRKIDPRINQGNGVSQ